MVVLARVQWFVLLYELDRKMLGNDKNLGINAALYFFKLAALWWDKLCNET